MTTITAVTTPAGRADGLTWTPKGDTMDVLRQHRDASQKAIVTRIHNLAVVRKAPPIMACCLSNDSPMTAGALRVLGV